MHETSALHSLFPHLFPFVVVLVGSACTARWTTLLPSLSRLFKLFRSCRLLPFHLLVDYMYIIHSIFLHAPSRRSCEA